MKSSSFKENNEIFYVVAGKSAKKHKELLKHSWKTILKTLCNDEFPDSEDIKIETNNNHVLFSYEIENLAFFVITLKHDNKKMFLVTCNEKITSFSLRLFGKWFAKLECGHSFLMDTTVDDYKFVKRIFCPICVEGEDE